jgi:hypothetical protein
MTDDSHFDVPSMSCCLDFILGGFIYNYQRRRLWVTNAVLNNRFRKAKIQFEESIPKPVFDKGGIRVGVDLSSIAYEKAVDEAFKHWFPDNGQSLSKAKFYITKEAKLDNVAVDWTLYIWFPDNNVQDKKEKRD